MNHSRTLPRPALGTPSRLQAWFDYLTRRLGGAASGEVNTGTGAEADTEVAVQLASLFDLADLEGRRVTLASLLAPAQPLLLVFIDPRSATCHEFMPDISGWQRVYSDRLAIALVSTGDPATNRAMTAEYGVQPVLLQRDLEVIEVYGLLQAPAAVLIRPDGRIAAGPRYGPQPIRHLVADTLGLVVPPPPVLELHAVGRGDTAPVIRRPDLEGNIVDLATFQGEPVLLLFWSPGCGYCQELLPHVLMFEQAVTRVRMIVISGGSVSVNQELGFASPVVLDDHHAIGQAFGVTGTPAAVLIGAKGTVASAVARGSVAVREYINRCHVPEMTPFPDPSGT